MFNTQVQFSSCDVNEALARRTGRICRGFAESLITALKAIGEGGSVASLLRRRIPRNCKQVLRSASYVSCQRDTALIRPHHAALLCAALQRRPCPAAAAVDRYLPPARHTAANPPQRVGQTDRQTPDRYTDPAPHTMRAVPINIAVGSARPRREFDSRSTRCRATALGKLYTPMSCVYKLVSVTAWERKHAHHTIAQVQYSWSRSVSWCLAEGYRSEY